MSLPRDYFSVLYAEKSRNMKYQKIYMFWLAILQYIIALCLHFDGCNALMQG